ncbi:hypothetical protein MferCBS31731_002164 [Microsporum ferrugineum]
MKFLYTSSLVSLCLLLSSTAASPAIRPGSTTLSPVPEPEVQAQNVPNDMASRPTPAKSVAQVTGSREQVLNEPNPTVGSAQVSPSAAQMTPAASQMAPVVDQVSPAASQMAPSAAPSPAEMSPSAAVIPSQPESSAQAEALPEEDVESSSSEDELLSGTHRVHKASPEQGNLCKTGDSYCCNEEHGKNTCVKSRTSCEQKVICCNNDHGYQFCMGDINFNMPITFNINFDF